MKVLFDHDGGVDDYAALALMAASPEVELIGVVCTPGDTHMEASVPTTQPILDLAGLSHVPVAEGLVEPPHPFPDHSRINGGKAWERMPMLSRLDRGSLLAPLSDLPGHGFAAETLLGADEPTVIVATGPLTSVAAALNEHPDVEDHVARLYWMGGAIDVPGNVEEPGRDGSAEWNAYADPAAAARVWDSNIDIYLCPLDATNSVPLTDDVIDRLAACVDSGLAAFVAQAYGSVDRAAYHRWDALTAVWVVEPDVITSMQTVPCEVLTEDEASGRVNRQMAGRAVTAALECDGATAADAIVRRLCSWRPRT